ncbi:MAG TPA: hypothetical protein DFK11_06050 [Lachnospiraceae bacterium]|nr:hypothetical protein [Lachnospiraceae bacterium]
MRIEKDVALIDNPLLRAAIWGDQSCLYKSVKFTGYVQASIDKIGKAFIEYCIARALGIYRLPNCGYDYYTDTSVLFNSLPEEDINGSMSILWTQKVELFSQHNICRENYFLGC